MTKNWARPYKGNRKMQEKWRYARTREKSVLYTSIFVDDFLLFDSLKAFTSSIQISILFKAELLVVLHEASKFKILEKWLCDFTYRKQHVKFFTHWKQCVKYFTHWKFHALSLRTELQKSFFFSSKSTIVMISRRFFTHPRLEKITLIECGSRSKAL